MTSSSRMAVLAFWEYAAFAVNSMVFVLVGIEITGIPMIAVIIVLLGRAISVYSLTALLSVFGQPRNDLFIRL